MKDENSKKKYKVVRDGFIGLTFFVLVGGVSCAISKSENTKVKQNEVRTEYSTSNKDNNPTQPYTLYDKNNDDKYLEETTTSIIDVETAESETKKATLQTETSSVTVAELETKPAMTKPQPETTTSQQPTKPSQPETTTPQKPTKPSQPETTTPQKPTKPSQPETTTPQEPTKPSQPETTTPQKPTKPSQPETTTPQEPTKPSQSETTTPQEPTTPSKPDKPHEHHFVTTKAYINDGEQTHTVEVTERCICGYKKVYVLKNQPCTYGEWKVLDEHAEVRACEACHHIEKRSHSYEEKVLYVKADNETHKKIIVNKCNTCGYSKGPVTEIEDHKIKITVKYEPTEDGHIKITTTECSDCGYKKVQNDKEICTFGPGTSADEETHSKECKECGKVKVEDHNKETTVEYEPTEDGHTKITTNTCGTCGYKEVLTEEEKCAYGPVVSVDGKTHSSECNECGKENVENHNIETTVEYKPTEDGHTKIITDTCEACGYEKVLTKEEECTFGSDVSVDEETHSRECEDCGKAIVGKHDLTSVNTPWKNNGDGTHSRTVGNVCTTCDYKSPTAVQTENCDLTGEKVTASDGITVTVTCPTCNTSTVVHTHDFTEKKEYAPNKTEQKAYCYKMVTTCTDPKCTYNVEIKMPHKMKDTSIVLPEEGMKKQACSNEGCTYTKWSPMAELKAYRAFLLGNNEVAYCEKKKSKTYCKK